MVKEELLDFICCPVCRGDIELTVQKKIGSDVLEGTLTCPKCHIDYVITGGIPNLLPP